MTNLLSLKLTIFRDFQQSSFVLIAKLLPQLHKLCFVAKLLFWHRAHSLSLPSCPDTNSTVRFEKKVRPRVFWESHLSSSYPSQPSNKLISHRFIIIIRGNALCIHSLLARGGSWFHLSRFWPTEDMPDGNIVRVLNFLKKTSQEILKAKQYSYNIRLKGVCTLHSLDHDDKN